MPIWQQNASPYFTNIWIQPPVRAIQVCHLIANWKGNFMRIAAILDWVDEEILTMQNFKILCELVSGLSKLWTKSDFEQDLKKHVIATQPDSQQKRMFNHKNFNKTFLEMPLRAKLPNPGQTSIWLPWKDSLEVWKYIFSCPEQLNRWPCHSLTRSQYFTDWHT